jgi:hypothetical protein
VSVRIESPDPVDLEANEDGRWHVVCSSPCNKALSTKPKYRISGKDVRLSEEFRLQPGKTLAIEVEPGAKPSRAGTVLVIIGVVGLVPGFVVTAAEAISLFGGLIIICPLVAAFASKNNQNSVYGSCLGDIATTIGEYYAKPYVWIPAIAGVAFMGMGGIWLAASTGSPTTVTQRAAQRTRAPIAESAQRAPEWQTPTPPGTKVLAIVPMIDLVF